MAISIHALREEGDGWRVAISGAGWKFLSTPSARRATASISMLTSTVLSVFLSTPSARRATYMDSVPHIHLDISIHALREEGDACS